LYGFEKQIAFPQKQPSKPVTALLARAFKFILSSILTMALFSNAPEAPEDRTRTQGYDPRDAPSIRVGFAKRLAAWIADQFVVAIFVTAAFLVVGEKNLRFFDGLDGTETESTLSDDDNDEASNDMEERLGAVLGSASAVGVVTGMNTALMLAYSLLELFTGASLGKRLAGIRIARADGVRASGRMLALRWLAKYSAYALALVPGLNVLSSLWQLVILSGGLLTLSATRQALHDLMAGGSAVFHSQDVLE
jgi:uncharacterized RDD family membrane protein YckC